MDTGSVLGDPTGTFAVLRHGHERWMGRLMRRDGGGPAQLSFAADATIARIPLGTFVMVAVPGATGTPPAQCRAKLLAITLEADAVAVEIEVDDPSVWGPTVPRPSVPYRDRRRWPRLQPSVAAEQPVQILIDVGPHSGRSLSGHVMDRSDGGIGVRLPMQAEARLCAADRLLCMPIDDIRPRRCTVRHRTLLPLGVRYGLRFEGEPLEAPTTYEPLWTCDSCGAGPLLGRSHAHCPACGQGRGDTALAYPDWDDLVATEEHTFFGGDRTCLRCGTAFSRLARNCGHCGTRLPVSR